MIFRIHLEWNNGAADYIDLKGTLEEVRDKAAAEIEKRKPDNYWSEQLTA